MSRRARLGVWPRWATVGLLVGILWGLAAEAAEPQPPDALIRAQLDAGEFAPAMAMARRITDANRRDAWLAQIAAAQARAGARQASLRSVAEIYDDRTRAEVLSNVAAEPLGGRGGGAQADFDSLIELIQSTVAPPTWDTVGGPGSIASFEGGVFVDTRGVLRPLLKQEATGRLSDLLASSAAGARQGDVRQSSPLRKVSLPRLEKHVQLRLAAGQPPTEDMRVLAGLRRIKYILVYPDSGDLVLAGPAGDWTANEEGRMVSMETEEPVVWLDDLVAVLRCMTGSGGGRFGCSITPTQDALARADAFVKQSNKTSIRPQQRNAWLERLRSQLGKQEIEVYGLDARSHAARAMVEADYRMKLVGMGLEEGVPGVQSYLDSVQVPKGQAPPPMGVLRWWFTLNYQAVLAAEGRHAFEIRGQGVKVLSENELLTAQGKRVPTGKSEALNRQFAHSFTKHFEALCNKYAVYAQLRNLFDLALVGALIREEGLADKTGWHLTCFGTADGYPMELGPAAKQVETVINHRVINKIHVLAGVSGGVTVDPAPLVARQAIEIDRYGLLSNRRSTAVAKDLPPGAWWWD